MNGISFKFDYSKAKTFLRNLNRVTDNVKSESQKIVVTVAEEIMRESKKQVPIATKTLYDSAYVQQEKVGRAVVRVVFGYGGDSNDTRNPKTGQLVSEYAIYVHEDLEALHPVGNAKFLENPVNAYLSKISSKLAAGLKPVFNKG